MQRSCALLSLALCTSACTRHPSACDEVAGGGSGENVLIILTDDIGIDKTGAYGEHPSPPPTPNIDWLASQGVLFRNAYASPTCSPTRASLLTGRHPSRTGIGRWIYAFEEPGQLPPDELTIPELLQQHSPHDYLSAAVGKWHLTGFTAPDPPGSPLDQGFDCHAGSLGNPLEAYGPLSTPRGYNHWEKSVDGEVGSSARYMTSDNADEAVARIKRMREPWFLYVAFNGAHDPLHKPPAHLLGEPLPAEPTQVQLFDAMVEATDTEVGRVLGAMDADLRSRTTVIYMTDNGTPGHGIVEPWVRSHGKGTVYEGGVNVPLIIAGPHVSRPGSESAALVSVVDLLPTVAQLADIDLAAVTAEDGSPLHLDGHSLLPWLEDPDRPSQREVVYTEAFWPNKPSTPQWRQQILREAEWKLARSTDGGQFVDQLFFIPAGQSDDGDDLLATIDSDAEASTAYQRLLAALDEQDADLGL